MGNTPNRGRRISRSGEDSTEDYGPAVVQSSFSYASMGGKMGHQEGGSGREDGVRWEIATTFEWRGKAKECSVAGSFNNWKYLVPMSRQPPISHNKAIFKATIELPEGDYEYKFFVNDNWVCNPENEMSPNTFGTKNNVVRVRREGGGMSGEVVVGDVMAALEQDEDANERPSTPEGPYGQSIPPPTSTFPPTLPRHLLQIILNKKVPDHVEPTLLPEPNHVMLNHLYALSIRDGVMVLSTTHRHRRKYITTLFYTPI